MAARWRQKHVAHHGVGLSVLSFYSRKQYTKRSFLGRSLGRQTSKLIQDAQNGEEIVMTE